MKKRTAFIIATIIVVTLLVLIAILSSIVRQNKKETSCAECPICDTQKTNEEPVAVEPIITVDIPEIVTYTFSCGDDECSNEEQMGEGEMIEVEVETREGTIIEMQPKEIPGDAPVNSTGYDVPVYKGITTLEDCSPLGGRFLTPDGEDADGICVVE